MKFSWYVASAVAMLAFFILFFPIWILANFFFESSNESRFIFQAALIDAIIASLISLLIARKTKVYALFGMWLLIGTVFALIFLVFFGTAIIHG